MSYNRNTLEKIIRESCLELKDEQPLLFFKSTNINERTMSSELSHKIRNRISEYHVNCEYNRMTDKYGNQIPKRISLDPNHANPTRVFPDIIVHMQEDDENNILVVELKMSWKNSLREADYIKLQRYIEELNYSYGVYLELGEEGITQMIWFPSEIDYD